jgi:hypothetical protein
VVTNHGFGPNAEMALYDEYRNRVTPWFPVGEDYPGRRSDFGINVRWVGVRDFDMFEWFTANLTLTGGKCTIELPDWRQQPSLGELIWGDLL